MERGLTPWVVVLPDVDHNLVTRVELVQVELYPRVIAERRDSNARLRFRDLQKRRANDVHNDAHAASF